MSTTRKTAAQLDREIAAALTAGPPVKISVHEVYDEDDEDEDAGEDADEDRYMISDDGGEFDDSEETHTPEVQGEIDDRRLHYRAMGRRVVVDAPPGKDWQ